MVKKFKSITLDDLEDMGINIKAILKDKFNKKKKRKNKKKLIKIK